MSKKVKVISAAVFVSLIALLLVGIVLCGSTPQKEPIKEIMKDAVLHEHDRIDLFGIVRVNPGLVSAFTVTGVLLVLCLILRIFVIPRFTRIPGKFQMLLEQGADIFSGTVREHSPHHTGFLGAYVFAAGAYIFLGTLFELFGVQAVSAEGASVTLPAPLSDINGAIAMGVMTYGVILVGGLINGGFKGMGNALKDFSLPISMSFRLYGALLGGALVTELVYYYAATSYGIPILVGVLFTLLHAVIQTYVLTMLAAVFYGESSEMGHKEKRKK